MRLLASAALAAFSLAASAQPPRAPDAAPQTVVQPPLDAPDRVVVTGMVPIPNIGEGAPLFTAADLVTLEKDTRKIATDSEHDYQRCTGRRQLVMTTKAGPNLPYLLSLEDEAALRVANAAGEAQAITAQAERSRQIAASGTVNMGVVNDLELERQAAVNKLQDARAKLAEARAVIGDYQKLALGERRNSITWADLDERVLKRKQQNVGLGIPVAAEVASLKIRNIKASLVKDKKGKPLVLVRGELSNISNQWVAVPALTAALIDDRGWVLTNATVEAPRGTGLNGGKTQAFQIEVRPAPDLLKSAIVTFAAKDHVEPRLGVGAFCQPKVD